MKHLAIFDLDGTLLNTIADLGAATNYALQANGYPQHNLEAYPMMVGNGVLRLIARALPQEHNDDATVDRMMEDFRPYYDAHLWDLTRPYQGVADMLRRLQQEGVAIAVASNKYEAAVVRLIEHFFPEINFVAVCGSLDGVPGKPDPSIVFRILSQHPTAKDDVIYIGDSAVDMETARRAGVESVGVTWGFRPESELAAAYANHIITDIADLLPLVKG